MAYRGTLSATAASAGSSAKNFIFGEQSTFKTTEDVLRAEYEAIWGDTLRPNGFRETYRTDVQKKEQAALCLSGGGIRSAAFSLGVIQVLAYRGLLTQFQYLSTVSGGGYIGGWLSRWIAEDNSRMRPISRACSQERMRYLRFPTCVRTRISSRPKSA